MCQVLGVQLRREPRPQNSSSAFFSQHLSHYLQNFGNFFLFRSTRSTDHPAVFFTSIFSWVTWLYLRCVQSSKRTPKSNPSGSPPFTHQWPPTYSLGCSCSQEGRETWPHPSPASRTTVWVRTQWPTSLSRSPAPTTASLSFAVLHRPRSRFLLKHLNTLLKRSNEY